jgi:hypothetical protein
MISFLLIFLPFYQLLETALASLFETVLQCGSNLLFRANQLVTSISESNGGPPDRQFLEKKHS